MFLVSADDEAVLVAVAAKGAKVGMMLYEVRRAAAMVAEILRADDEVPTAVPDVPEPVLAAVPALPAPTPPVEAVAAPVAAVPAGVPAYAGEQPAWSSYAPTGSVMPGAQPVTDVPGWS